MIQTLLTLWIASSLLVPLYAQKRRERNQVPIISSFKASSSEVVLPCPWAPEESVCAKSESCAVSLTVEASDPDGDTLVYAYRIPDGRIIGTGPQVTWNLYGLSPATYTAVVEVADPRGAKTSKVDQRRRRFVSLRSTLLYARRNLSKHRGRRTAR